MWDVIPISDEVINIFVLMIDSYINYITFITAQVKILKYATFPVAGRPGHVPSLFLKLALVGTLSTVGDSYFPGGLHVTTDSNVVQVVPVVSRLFRHKCQ